ncbi:MAG: endonuclease III [Candidatus Omnitrophica bacterium]|nr:endonuclease III [Candidatus Omnitrophota bacterium]MBU1869854.1 endonuclease III [Candidatus Omnitrophota bacterium]
MNTRSVTVKLIRKQVNKCIVPSVTQVSRRNDPYQVLISCILSLRTKDKTTVEASKRLFQVADTPKDMVELSVSRMEKLIYPVGFYRNKSRVILEANKKILGDFGGKVPNNIDDLLSIKGVGRKTANLVLGLGFNIPAICVDTHVHRITNRLGWIKTRSPEETEEALKKIIPRHLWVELNTILVTFGQNICLPVSPFCSKCSVRRFCKRIGVGKSR